MLVMGETRLFKASNQLNQLLCKMLHCFDVYTLVTPAGQNRNASKTQVKHA